MKSAYSRTHLGLRGCGFLLGLLPAGVALAQVSTAVLVGNVVDASTKTPVADVVVTATSPSLQGEQVVVTDGTGLYRVPQLPSGVYTLRFEKESYRPFSRSGIDVAADRTLRFNVELLPETAGTETVTVIGAPPTIDVGSSATGTTVTPGLHAQPRRGSSRRPERRQPVLRLPGRHCTSGQR